MPTIQAARKYRCCVQCPRCTRQTEILIGDPCMNWDLVLKKTTPYILKIETPAGHGTGFLCLYNQDKSICGIATALHVVFYADDWQQPIRVRHEQSGEVARLSLFDSKTFVSPYFTVPRWQRSALHLQGSFVIDSWRGLAGQA